MTTMTTMTTMMRSALDLLATFPPGEVLGLGAVLAMKTSILLLVAGVATLVAARGTAALRHCVWSLALAGALVLPFVAGTLPWSWQVLPARQAAPFLTSADAFPAVEASPTAFAGGERVGYAAGAAGAAGAVSVVPAAPKARVVSGDGVPATRSGDAAVAVPTAALAAAPAVTRTATQAATVAPAATAAGASRTLPIGWLALGLWALVADLLLLHLLAGRFSLALLARRATPVLDDTFLDELVVGTRAAGIRRPVRLLWSPRARVPMTWGVRRPVVVVPEDARSWSRERIGLVLQHELAHVRRMDDVTHLLARVACALYWFNPLVWWAAARLRDESELACDDQVLRTGARASTYAGHLLELVASLGVRAAPVGALPLAQRSRFEGRLLAILDPARRRGGLAPARAFALSTGAAAMVTLLGAVAPARAEAERSDVILETEAPAAESIGEADVVTDAVTPPGATSADIEVPVEQLDEAEPEAGADPTEDESPMEAALALADSASVRALIRALTQDADAGVRRAAAWALGQLEDRTATAALSTALADDTSVEVRRTVAWALGQIEDPGAVHALGQALSDADAEVRHTALWALGQIESPEAIPALTRALGDEAAEVRKTAVWALGQIESPGAVGPLSSLVDDPDAEVREQVMWALGQIESAEAVAPVSRGLSDASPRVRQQAAWALGQIEAAEALPALADALADTDPEVAVTAAWAIGQIEPASAPPALLEAVRSGSGELRSTALWALSQIEDPAAVPALTEALRDENTEVRAAALRALAEIRDESAIRAITGLLEDPDPEVRAAAVRALAGRGGWGGDPRPRPRPEPRPRPRPNGG
jgi:HEAT repeat protein/beta-lactamase regulating signal transducer with metallopeptidase domain